MAALEDREYQMDRLEFVKNQLNLLIEDVKIKIKAISENVAVKVTPRGCGSCSLLTSPHPTPTVQVSDAMAEEISRLHVLVDHFHSNFHPSPHVLKIYKSVSRSADTPPS